MDQQNKLKKFQDAVFQEIEAKVSKIHEDALALEKEELEKNTNKQLQKAYNQIQYQVSEIRKAARRDVAKFSLSSKRDVLKKRIDLMNSVFDGVKNKLSEYTKTDEYKSRLLARVSSLTKNESGLSSVKIFLGEQDMGLADKVKSACSVPCEILSDALIKCGGFILKDEKACLYFDETLESKLYEQKTYFIENSGLTL